MSIDQLTGGNIEPRGLEEEMRSSYLDYAMSVIVGRALPDVRDGLKPVHRRVLFSMNENGLQPNRSYAKCARIVGDVMGKYHPHGDCATWTPTRSTSSPTTTVRTTSRWYSRRASRTCSSTARAGSRSGWRPTFR